MNVVGKFLLSQNEVGLKRSILTSIYNLRLKGTVQKKKNDQNEFFCEVIVSGSRKTINKLRMSLPTGGMQYIECEGFPSLDEVRLVRTGLTPLLLLMLFFLLCSR